MLKSVCVDPVVSVIPTRVRPLCAILTCLRVFRVVVLLHPVKAFLLLLAVVFVLSFVFVLAFAFARLAFALAFVLLASAFARTRLVFAFVVRASPSTCLVFVTSIRFSFD